MWGEFSLWDQQLLACSPKKFTAVLLMGWLNVCFQLGIGKVNSACENTSEICFFGEQAKNMPQTKKWIRKKNISVCPTTSVTTQLTSSVERAMSFFWEEMLSTTRTTTKQKNTSSYPPCAKRWHAANSHHNSDSEGDTEWEVDNTPLTKTNIPTIVNAVLSNITMEGNSSKDISHLSE